MKIYDIINMLYESYERGINSLNPFYKRKALRARAMYVTRLDRWKTGETAWRK